MRKTLLPILLLLFLAQGCAPSGNMPKDLNDAPRPITLVAVGPGGVIISDGAGGLHSYGRTYYFAQTVMNSDLKPGDILAGANDGD